MIKWTIFLLTSLTFICITSCTSETKALNSFGDPAKQELYKAADARDSKKVKSFFTSDKKELKATAALLCGSLQDSTLLPDLYLLLQDEDDQVRANAAFAIGQTGSANDVAYLISWGKKEKAPIVLKELMIAAAKLFDPKINITSKEKTVGAFIYDESENEFVEFLSNVEISSEEVQIGLGYAMTYLHRNKIYSPELPRRAQFALQTASRNAKIALANGIASFNGDWFANHEGYFMQWIKTERDPDVRISLITIVSKLNTSEGNDLLAAISKANNSDYRLNVQAIRMLAKNGKYKSSLAIETLSHSNDLVVIEALETIGKISSDEIASITAATASRSAQIKATVSKVKIINGADASGEECLGNYYAASNEYDKSFFVLALGQAPNRTDQLIDILLKEKSQVITYAAAQALVSIHSKDQWKGTVQLSEVIASALSLGNTGVMETFGVYLSDAPEKKFHDEEMLKLDDAINAALKGLILPRDIESYNALVRAHNAMLPNKMEEAKPTSTYQPNWEYIASLPNIVTIEWTTTKGKFKTEFYVNEAPTSVGLISKLAEEGFYKDKYFHRVIANFVAQGGCPIGNGMGGLDQPMRSEFTTLRYERGSIGLASAGKDTESCQFFITHSLMPSLDGRYTIIGKVIEGMEVVDQLTIGDRIEQTDMN